MAELLPQPAKLPELPPSPHPGRVGAPELLDSLQKLALDAFNKAQSMGLDAYYKALDTAYDALHQLPDSDRVRVEKGLRFLRAEAQKNWDVFSHTALEVGDRLSDLANEALEQVLQPRDAQRTRTKTIEADRWEEFFDQLSDGNRGRITTLEVLDPEFGEEILSHGQPLSGVVYDRAGKGNVISIELGKDGVCYSHAVKDPTEVHTEQDGESGRLLVLEIRSADGGQTLLELG
jgi:hypothetical protein